MSADTIRLEIRAKIAELAAVLGNDASTATDDDILPFTGLLDSAALMEFLSWYEDHFRLSLEQDEINIDNFGSIRAMTNYTLRR